VGRRPSANTISLTGWKTLNTKHKETRLEQYGWDGAWAAGFAPFAAEGYLPARILSNNRGIYTAVAEAGELRLQPSGSFRHLVDLGLQETPVGGDWCAYRPASEGQGLIEGVTDRRSFLPYLASDSSRDESGEHRVALANIDTVVIVMDAARDFNPRRVERFLPNITAGGADPALLLNKIDLLLGRQEMKTTEVRHHDGRGRHTTTSRRLLLLPNNAMVIDTPGIRAVGISGGEDSVRNSFQDIRELAEECRFSNCSHRHEPGCTVRQALSDGRIDQDRYQNFLRVLEESRSREEELQRRQEKEMYIAKVQYQMRRERNRKKPN